MLVTSLIFSALVEPCFFSRQATDYKDIPQSLLKFWQGRWKMHCIHSRGEQFTAYNEVKVLQRGQLLQEETILLDKKQLTGYGHTKYQSASGTWHHSFQNSAGDYLEFIGAFDLQNQQFVTSVKSIAEGSKPQRVQLLPSGRKGYQWQWQEMDTTRKAWHTSWRVNYRKLC